MYGIQPLDDYTDIRSVSWKIWFKLLYDYVTSRVKLVTVTSAYTFAVDVFYVRADATAGAFTVTLPAALTCSGRQVVIKKIDSSVNAVTISRSGTDTIEGSSTMSLAAQWDKQILISNGNTGWEKL